MLHVSQKGDIVLQIENLMRAPTMSTVCGWKLHTHKHWTRHNYWKTPAGRIPVTTTK